MKEELFFGLPHGRTLFIRPEAVTKMNKYRQLKINDTEAGGILIGRILLENDNFIIDDVSEPMVSDKRKRTRFIRKPQGHQEYFDSVWDATDGRCFYLGEWHTHPEMSPTPSLIDRKEWGRIIKLNFESDILFFIILGTENIKVWYSDRNKRKITELKRGDFSWVGDH